VDRPLDAANGLAEDHIQFLRFAEMSIQFGKRKEAITLETEPLKQFALAVMLIAKPRDATFETAFQSLPLLTETLGGLTHRGGAAADRERPVQLTGESRRLPLLAGLFGVPVEIGRRQCFSVHK
jgi:hypothetical protein